ncbi:MAG: trehalase family glycosidase [Candidatus Helarchaeota archaeon]
MLIDTPDKKINKTSSYITNYWEELINPADRSHKILPIPNPYITPSKKFNAIFYWDNYFEILGIIIDNRYDLAKKSVENFIHEIDKFGFVPNYNGPQGISKTRSQPPFLSSMVLELFSISNDKEILQNFLEPIKKEYEYWTRPPKLFRYGLSRYYDTSFFSKFQPFSTMAESGWDFTNRFRNIKKSLPVDLNTLLSLYEKDLALIIEIIGISNAEEKKKWEVQYNKRINLIDKYMWNQNQKFFFDYSTQRNKTEKSSSLAGFFPLWANSTGPDKAESCAKKAYDFLNAGGFVTTLDAKIDGWWKFMGLFGLQWCYPVGWAPLQWIVNKGLCNYNYDSIAAEASWRYLSMIADIFMEKGEIFEKYNIVDKSIKVKAPQGMDTGFGWTNSIFQTLLTRIILGIEPNLFSGFKFSPRIPTVWQYQDISASFKNYPKLGLNLTLKIEDERNDEKLINYLFNVNKSIEIDMRFFNTEGENFQSILLNNEEQINSFKIEEFRSSVEKKTIATSIKPMLLKEGHNSIIVS